MKIKLEHFIHDLVWLIKEDYNAALEDLQNPKTETEKAFGEGQSVAYHHTLEMIVDQLRAFGVAEEHYKGIAPPVGEKAKFTKASF